MWRAIFFRATKPICFSRVLDAVGRILAIYQAIRLNGSERGWGVAYRVTGALADSGGKLLVRLSQDEAQAFAARMSSEATPANTGFRRRSIGVRR